MLDIDGNELHFSSAPGGFDTRTASLETNNYPFDEAKVYETAERSYLALQEYHIFDSLMPAAFHALTEFAAMNFHSDRSMITLIDRNRQWLWLFKIRDAFGLFRLCACSCLADADRDSRREAR